MRGYTYLQTEDSCRLSIECPDCAELVGDAILKSSCKGGALMSGIHSVIDPITRSVCNEQPIVIFAMPKLQPTLLAS